MTRNRIQTKKLIESEEFLRLWLWKVTPYRAIRSQHFYIKLEYELCPRLAGADNPRVQPSISRPFGIKPPTRRITDFGSDTDDEIEVSPSQNVSQLKRGIFQDKSARR